MGVFGALRADSTTITSLPSGGKELRQQLGKMLYMLLRSDLKAEEGLPNQGRNCLAARMYYGPWGYSRVGGGGGAGKGGQKGHLTQDSQSPKATCGDFAALSPSDAQRC